MPIDKKYLKANDFWFKSQENLIKEIELNNEYTLKEIELHKKTIAINKESIAHYKKGIADQKKVIEKYIKENSDKTNTAQKPID